MITLNCLRCGLTVSRERSRGDLCPRCLARDHQEVQLIPVSDQPSAVHRSSRGRLTITSRVERAGAAATVMVRGELDSASAAFFEDAISELCSGGVRDLAIDLGGVEFIDSSGLNAILCCRELCARHSCALILAPAQRPAQRVFEVTGVMDMLPFRKRRLALHRSADAR